MNTIKVLGSVLTGALDTIFNDGSTVYTVYLRYNNSDIADASVVVDFKDSGATMVGNYATLVLEGSKYIPLDEGVNVDEVALRGLKSGTTEIEYFEESVTPVTFTANGTYTISQITIKVGF